MEGSGHLVASVNGIIIFLQQAKLRQKIMILLRFIERKQFVSCVTRKVIVVQMSLVHVYNVELLDAIVVVNNSKFLRKRFIYKLPLKFISISNIFWDPNLGGAFKLKSFR